MRFTILILMLIAVKVLNVYEKPKPRKKPRDVMAYLRREDELTGRTCYLTFNNQRVDCVVITD